MTLKTLRYDDHDHDDVVRMGTDATGVSDSQATPPVERVLARLAPAAIALRHDRAPRLSEEREIPPAHHRVEHVRGTLGEETRLASGAHAQASAPQSEPKFRSASAMPRMRHPDWQCLSAVIGDLYDAETLDTFATRAVQGLRRLVAGDRASFHLARPKPQHVTTIASDGRPSIPGAEVIVARFLPEHYLMRHHLSHGAQGWVRTTDVLTRDAFRRSNLYKHYYRHVGIEFQIAVTFPSPCGGVFTMALSREVRDFSDRDKRVLDLLVPHLIQARKVAAGLTGLRREVAALEQVADLANVGVVFLDHDRRIQHISVQSRRLLDAYFASPRDSANSLPRVLDTWVAHGARVGERIVPDRQPLTIHRQGGRLQVQLATGPDEATLILTETVTELPLEPLEILGLSRREAEVLKWVAEGKRNGEIATVLGIASATVHHHLEHIHRKLGVETRTAAAARALEACQRAPTDKAGAPPEPAPGQGTPRADENGREPRRLKPRRLIVSHPRTPSFQETTLLSRRAAE